MQSFVCTLLAWSLVSGAGPESPTPVQRPSEVRGDVNVSPGLEERLALGEDAWRRGDYAEAREILAPLAERKLDDPLFRQRVLVYLADATINDAGLDPAERRELASRYLERLMDADPSWQMPKEVYTPELWNLYVEVRNERTRELGAECRADLTACKADLRIAQAQIESQEEAYDVLQQRYLDQEVEVRQGVARSRALALIPFGVGHFYNATGTEGPVRRRNLALGGTFLGLEAAFGIAGLGLLIQRTAIDGCERTAGFTSGSLDCQPRDDDVSLDDLVARRKAEEVMAWAFGITLIADIIVAQILFRPFETTTTDRVPRRELEDPTQSEDEARDRRKRPRATFRAAPTLSPSGAGVGVHIEF